MIHLSVIAVRNFELKVTAAPVGSGGVEAVTARFAGPEAKAAAQWSGKAWGSN